MKSHPPSQPVALERAGNVTRRRVLQTTAWSVPAITLATQSPAFARTPSRTWNVTSNDLSVTGRRCTNVESKQFTAVVATGPLSIPAGTSLRLLLPDGLRFTSGAERTQTVPITATTSPAVVTVPTFQIVGASGTYAVRAELINSGNAVLAESNLSVEATAAAGALVSMPKTPSTESQAPSYSPTETGLLEALRGSTSGNYYGTDHAVIVKSTNDLDSGNVLIWGANHPGSSPSQPRRLPTPENTPHWRLVTSFTSVGTNGPFTTSFRRRTGGLAVSRGNVVTQWYEDAENNVPFTVRSVNGVPSTILDAKAVDGHAFVLTTQGLYHWEITAGTGNITVGSENRLASTMGATQMTAWGQQGNYFEPSGPLQAGVAVYPVPNRTNPPLITTYRFSSAESRPASTSFTAPDGVTFTKLVATSAGIVGRTSAGSLLFRGPGYGGPVDQPWNAATHTWITPTSTGPDNAELPTDVIDFSTWGVGRRLHGGLWIKEDGTVGQWHGDSSWRDSIAVTSDTGQPAFTNITKVFAQDGNYMALDSGGRSWVWGNNLDHASYGKPRVSDDGAGTTMDLNIWGVHHAYNDPFAKDEFFGGGYVVKGTPTCSIGG